MESKNHYKQTNKTKLTDAENRMVVARGERAWGLGEMGEWGQEVQACSYKISKSWGCNVEHGNYNQ